MNAQNTGGNAQNGQNRDLVRVKDKENEKSRKMIHNRKKTCLLFVDFLAGERKSQNKSTVLLRNPLCFGAEFIPNMLKSFNCQFKVVQDHQGP